MKTRKHQVNTRRQARLKAGLSEVQAARIAGVRLSTLLAYERGSRVPYHRALALSANYGCRIEIFKQ